MTLALPARLLCALLLLLPVAALAQADDLPPIPERNPLRAKGAAPTEPKADLPGDAPTIPWSNAEVAAAKAECTKLLAKVKLDYERLPPIREGRCGAPAPISVKAVGADPTVIINPPATITCRLAVALHGWLKNKVQPQAKLELDAAVVELRNASSYSCRNRYNGANTLISEHALANALDISEFVLASGDAVTVLDHWPKVVAVAPPSSNPTRETKPKAMAAVKVSTVSRTIPASSDTMDVRKASANPFKVGEPPADPATNPFVAPEPQGGAAAPAVEAAAPEAEETPAETEPAPAENPAPPRKSLAERKSAFVRTVHGQACKTFGTTLGPEANEAHANHFHLDMKKRRSGFCE